MKKENAKIIVAAVLAVAVSLGILAGVLVAAGRPSSAGTPYSGSGILSQGSPGEGTAPPTQDFLKEKYGVYSFEEGDGVLRLFSRKQWEALENKRKNGERYYLTYQEVRFLIEDTVSLYKQYGSVTLTEERWLPIHKTDILDIVGDVANGDVYLEPVGEISRESSYSKACEDFQRMREEIHSILLYRLYMLDSGWRFVQYSLGEDGLPKVEKLSDRWDSKAEYCTLALSLDEGRARDSEAYERQLEADFLGALAGKPLQAPLLLIQMDPLEEAPALRIRLLDTEKTGETELYPANLFVYQQPKPYTGIIKPVTAKGNVLELWSGDGIQLEKLLADGFWQEGEVDCEWTYAFCFAEAGEDAIQKRYTYHSGCGVVYDAANRRYMDLGGLERRTVNRILERAAGADKRYGGWMVFTQVGGTITVGHDFGAQLAEILSAGVWEPAEVSDTLCTFCLGEDEFLYLKEKGVVVDMGRGMGMRLCEREKSFLEDLLSTNFPLDPE